jgi:hypothetical protein
MEAVIKNAKPGVIVSVGTERGFILAGMVNRATGYSAANRLLLADDNLRANNYNRYNIALLDLTRPGDIDEFKRLRETNSFDQIQSLLRQRQVSVSSREILSNPVVFNQWLEWVRGEDYSVWEGFNRPPVRSLNPFRAARARQFTDAVYAHNPEIFNSVQAMAKSQRITVANINLTSRRDVNDLRDLVLASDEPLSVLDISNVWQRAYSTAGELEYLFATMSVVADDGAIVQITNQLPKLAQMFKVDSGAGERILWSYSGFNYGAIRGNWQSFGAFSKYLVAMQKKRELPGVSTFKRLCNWPLLPMIRTKQSH